MTSKMAAEKLSDIYIRLSSAIYDNGNHIIRFSISNHAYFVQSQTTSACLRLKYIEGTFNKTIVNTIYCNILVAFSARSVSALGCLLQPLIFFAIFSTKTQQLHSSICF